MESFLTFDKNPGSEIKNCRYCPIYGTGCDGIASDCLCLRCPRNLGQCTRVRYCRETESILDFSQEGEPGPDESMRLEIDSYFRRME